MSQVRLLLAAAAALALVACAPTPRSTPSELVTPPATAGEAPAQAGAGEPGPNSGGTYPYGSPSTVQTGNAEAGQENATVTGPGGSIWLKPGTTNERYRADADDCYSYAQAQIANDARIESDANAAFSETPGSITSTALRRQMSQFARDRSLPRLFGECMEAKGYTRG